MAKLRNDEVWSSIMLTKTLKYRLEKHGRFKESFGNIIERMLEFYEKAHPVFDNSSPEEIKEKPKKK